jgi:hypothetical protein
MTRIHFGTTATLAVTLWAVPVAAQRFEPRAALETRRLVSQAHLFAPRPDSLTTSQPLRPFRGLTLAGRLHRQTPAEQTAAAKPQSYMKRHPAKFGALVGAAAGAAIGIIAAATYDCPPNSSCSTLGAALFGYPLMGAGLGAIVGWAIKH